MDFVLNPESGRMVKAGGKKWRDLVKRNMIPNSPIRQETSTVLHEAIDQREAKAVSAIFKRKDSPLTKKVGMRKGTHSHAKGGKVYEYRNRPTQIDMAHFTAQAATRTIHRHMDKLSSDLEDCHLYGGDEELGDFEYKLKNLILQEMISTNIVGKPTAHTKLHYTGKKKKLHDNEYELEEEPESERELPFETETERESELEPELESELESQFETETETDIDYTDGTSSLVHASSSSALRPSDSDYLTAYEGEDY